MASTKISHNCTKVHPGVTHYDWAKKNKITPGTIKDTLSRPKDPKKDKEYMKLIKKDKHPLGIKILPFKNGGKLPNTGKFRKQQN
jgi:hypothetical protein